MIHNKRGIEFSVNVIVIMIISMVILGSGLTLFFNLKQGAVEYVEGIDSNTEAQLRALMINTNQKVSLYPTDITLERKKSVMVGLGITNTADYIQNFTIGHNVSVMYYSKPESNPQNYTLAWDKVYAIQMSNYSGINLRQNYFIGKNIPPKEMFFKNVLITVPKSAAPGLYVLTFQVRNMTKMTGGGSPACSWLNEYSKCISDYGLVKLYVNVP